MALDVEVKGLHGLFLCQVVQDHKPSAREKGPAALDLPPTTWVQMRQAATCSPTVS